MRAVLTLICMMSAMASAVLIGAPAQAASYDCSKAVAADEVAVCRDGTLSAMDSEMAALFYAYDKVPMLMGANGARHDDSEAFLADRGKCGADITCLRRVYTARMAALRTNIDGAMQDFANLQSGIPAPVPGVLPAGVEAIIGSYADACSQLKGTLAEGADRPLMMSTDLDGDGVADYLLNPQNLKCNTSASLFCGNGGCQIAIAVSGDSFVKPVDALGGMPSLVQSEAGTFAKVWVDSTNCPKAGAEDACWATFAWAVGKHTVTYAAAPAPGV